LNPQHILRLLQEHPQALEKIANRPEAKQLEYVEQIFTKKRKQFNEKDVHAWATTWSDRLPRLRPTIYAIAEIALEEEKTLKLRISQRFLSLRAHVGKTLARRHLQELCSRGAIEQTGEAHALKGTARTFSLRPPSEKRTFETNTRGGERCTTKLVAKLRFSRQLLHSKPGQLRVFSMLLAEPDLTAKEIADRLQLNLRPVQQHLKALADDGLVVRAKRRYRVAVGDVEVQARDRTCGAAHVNQRREARYQADRELHRRQVAAFLDHLNRDHFHKYEVELLPSGEFVDRTTGEVSTDAPRHRLSVFIWHELEQLRDAVVGGLRPQSYASVC
jgi:DNA-binding transcriptional ArsR family regulator